MNIKRMARHLTETHRKLNRAFPRATLSAIEQTIAASETSHDGEIRFAVEASLDSRALLQDQSSRERAIEVFSRLRIWDTHNNSGVLIYLLLADRDVEIVADRGISARVSAAEWEKICRSMETAFSKGNYKSGVVNGIEAVSQHLAKAFPAIRNARNELPDVPVVL